MGIFDLAKTKMQVGKLFSIDSGADFLRVFAEHLIAGKIIPGFCPKDDPFQLADATIYVPSRTFRTRLVRNAAGKL